MFGRNGVTRIADIDAVCVRFLAVVTPSFRRRRKRRPGGAALPEIRVSVKFDGACSWREFAGVVQYVDQNLLDLAGFEIKGQIARPQIGSNRDRFIVGKGRNLVEGLFQALPDIAALQVHAALNVPPYAQL